MSWRKVAHTVIEGWEFSLRDYGQSALRRFSLSKSNVELPANYYEHDICIKHLDSGIGFRFSAYDAITKLVQEKQTRNPLASHLPSYNSPLLHIDEEQYDSAYVGSIVIEKPGEEPENINPVWEDVDRNTLVRQLKWTSCLQKLDDADIPDKYTYSSGEGPILSFVNRKKLKKLQRAEGQRSLVNFVCPLYDSRFDFDKEADSSCFFNLVVLPKWGWFVYLHQYYYNFFEAKRTRELTMHCPFDSNTVFREIIEKQSINFEEVLSVKSASAEDPGSNMGVHFHEAKQLRFQGGSISHNVRDIRQCTPYPVGESMTQPPVEDLSAPLKELDVSSFEIESFLLYLAICSGDDPFEAVEDEFGTHTQIIPLFKHPCKLIKNRSADGFEIPKYVFRKLYKAGGDDSSSKSREKFI